MVANLKVGIQSIDPVPGVDGSRVMTITTFGADPIDLVLSESEAIQLVRLFQQGFLDRMAARTESPNYPALRVVDANVAHGTESTGLLLDTAEIGHLVLAFDPNLADKLKHEIDRASEATLARRNAS